MLHSGSRGIGNAIGQYFITRAKDEMAKQDVHLPDKDLAYLVEGESCCRLCEGGRLGAALRRNEPI
jgi:RNA-splicing ligase RtcB